MKLKFRKLHQTVVSSINAASIMDFLFQEAVIGHDDIRRLVGGFNIFRTKKAVSCHG